MVANVKVPSLDGYFSNMGMPGPNSDAVALYNSGQTNVPLDPAAGSGGVSSGFIDSLVRLLGTPEAQKGLLDAGAALMPQDSPGARFYGGISNNLSGSLRQQLSDQQRQDLVGLVGGQGTVASSSATPTPVATAANSRLQGEKPNGLTQPIAQSPLMQAMANPFAGGGSSQTQPSPFGRRTGFGLTPEQVASAGQQAQGDIGLWQTQQAIPSEIAQREANTEYLRALTEQSRNPQEKVVAPKNELIRRSNADGSESLYVMDLNDGNSQAKPVFGIDGQPIVSMKPPKVGEAIKPDEVEYPVGDGTWQKAYAYPQPDGTVKLSDFGKPYSKEGEGFKAPSGSAEMDRIASAKADARTFYAPYLEPLDSEIARLNKAITLDELGQFNITAIRGAAGPALLAQGKTPEEIKNTPVAELMGVVEKEIEKKEAERAVILKAQKKLAQDNLAATAVNPKYMTQMPGVAGQQESVAMKTPQEMSDEELYSTVTKVLGAFNPAALFQKKEQQLYQ